jgi:hypothetical protein
MWKETRLLEDVAERALVGRDKGAGAILPDLSGNVAEAVANLIQPPMQVTALAISCRCRSTASVL